MWWKLCYMAKECGGNYATWQKNVVEIMLQGKRMWWKLCYRAKECGGNYATGQKKCGGNVFMLQYMKKC
jgi:hypothetical protein